MGPKAVSLVERSIIHCPYLTIGGFTVIFITVKKAKVCVNHMRDGSGPK